MQLNEVVHLLCQQESLPQLARAFKEVFVNAFSIQTLGILQVNTIDEDLTIRPLRIDRRASLGFEKKERNEIIENFRKLLQHSKVQEKQLDCILTDAGKIEFFMVNLGGKRRLLLYWRESVSQVNLQEMMLTTCVVIGSQWLWIDRLEEMERSRLHDDLTGLYNQKYLDLVLDHELRRGERFSARFAVVFIDLDNFKGINDAYGHLAGSYILKQVGTLLRDTLREVDSIVRYGGDEYVVVLLGADQFMALKAAERIRATVAEHDFKIDEDITARITCSLGVACYPDHGRTKKELLEAADGQLYRSKDRGRNRVTSLSHAEKIL